MVALELDSRVVVVVDVVVGIFDVDAKCLHSNLCAGQSAN